jgi:hypothetical protein
MSDELGEALEFRKGRRTEITTERTAGDETVEHVEARVNCFEDEP